MNKVFRISPSQVERERKIQLTGELPVEFLGEPDTEMVKFSHPVKYNLELSATLGGIVLNGQISTQTECVCGRCLNKFDSELSAKICHFYEKDDSSELDIAEDVREDLLLEIPMNPNCSKNCKGLCLKCGQDLNKKTCKCDDTPAGHPVWDDLKPVKK